jgi:hypothetical protein
MDPFSIYINCVQNLQCETRDIDGDVLDRNNCFTHEYGVRVTDVVVDFCAYVAHVCSLKTPTKLNSK